MTDFDVLYPHQAQFLRQLSAVVSQRRLIEADASLTDDSKRGKIRQLTLGDSSTTIDDIGSVFLATFSSVMNNILPKITIQGWPKKCTFSLHLIYGTTQIK